MRTNGATLVLLVSVLAASTGGASAGPVQLVGRGPDIASGAFVRVVPDGDSRRFVILWNGEDGLIQGRTQLADGSSPSATFSIPSSGNRGFDVALRSSRSGGFRSLIVVWRDDAGAVSGALLDTAGEGFTFSRTVGGYPPSLAPPRIVYAPGSDRMALLVIDPDRTIRLQELDPVSVLPLETPIAVGLAAPTRSGSDMPIDLAYSIPASGWVVTFIGADLDPRTGECSLRAVAAGDPDSFRRSLEVAGAIPCGGTRLPSFTMSRGDEEGRIALAWEVADETAADAHDGSPLTVRARTIGAGSGDLRADPFPSRIESPKESFDVDPASASRPLLAGRDEDDALLLVHRMGRKGGRTESFRALWLTPELQPLEQSLPAADAIAVGGALLNQGSLACSPGAAGSCLLAWVASSNGGPTVLATEVEGTAPAPLDNDTDGDGVANVSDNCPTVVNPQQENFDGDGPGDACDPDDDDDGTSDPEDCAPRNPDIRGIPGSLGPTIWLAANGTLSWLPEPDAESYNIYRTESGTPSTILTATLCRATNVTDPLTIVNERPLPGQMYAYVVSKVNCFGVGSLGTDSSGVPRPEPSLCLDEDTDSYPDGLDNCPDVPNTDQLDFDADGAGDDCDPDDDQDGLTDDLEGELGTNPFSPDSDGDGLTDGVEVFVMGSDPTRADTDQDAVGDAADNCPSAYNPAQENIDSDGLGDVCERRLAIGLAATGGGTSQGSAYAITHQAVGLTEVGSAAVLWGTTMHLEPGFAQVCP